MLMTRNEENFLLAHLEPSSTVLEWGSGASTAQIAMAVKSIFSIEHEQQWYERIRRMVRGIKNVTLTICPPKPQYDDRRDGDGTEEQFAEYISLPLKMGFLGRFDVVLIDGRARAGCAKICPALLRPDGLVFIHDFDLDDPQRVSYTAAFDVLTLVDKVETLAKFRPKQQDEIWPRVI